LPRCLGISCNIVYNAVKILHVFTLPRCLGISCNIVYNAVKILHLLGTEGKC